jgi:hypothetical protein
MSEEYGSLIEYQEDLSSAEAPKALPANDYPAEITATELGVSQTSGKMRVAVTFRINPEAYPADYEDAASFPDGKQVTFYIGAEQDKAARFRMRKFCEAIGVKLGKKLDINDWIGRTAMLELTTEEWEGVERERVRSVKAA